MLNLNDEKIMNYKTVLKCSIVSLLLLAHPVETSHTQTGKETVVVIAMIVGCWKIFQHTVNKESRENLNLALKATLSKEQYEKLVQGYTVPLADPNAQLAAVAIKNDYKLKRHQFFGKDFTQHPQPLIGYIALDNSMTKGTLSQFLIHHPDKQIKDPITRKNAKNILSMLVKAHNKETDHIPLAKLDDRREWFVIKEPGRWDHFLGTGIATCKRSANYEDAHGTYQVSIDNDAQGNEAVLIKLVPSALAQQRYGQRTQTS